ncbi:MAG: anti-sigma regulatory factor [Cyanobacteria bacterium P01_H01_bin.58]
MPRHERLLVDSRLETLFKVHHWFKELCASLETDWEWIRFYRDRLNIALAEGFTNAVRHAHAALPPDTPIAIDIAVKDDRIDIRIWDQGDPFDPNKLSEPEPGSLLQGGGYGWFLLRRVVDDVSYQRCENQNCLEITQYRP